MCDKEWPDLKEMEWVIKDDEFEGDERAFRNVHPRHRINGKLTSQIYEPSDDDAGLRSSARENKISAEAHYDEYTSNNGSSLGVCSVRLSTIEELDLRWVDDSAYVSEVTGHASIDFRKTASARQAKNLARRLARSAEWEHPPE